jgi:hypothetical protein
MMHQSYDDEEITYYVVEQQRCGVTINTFWRRCYTSATMAGIKCVEYQYVTECIGMGITYRWSTVSIREILANNGEIIR